MDYTHKIGILLVDDHEIMRDGLRALIYRQPYMEVVGEASDGAEAVDLAQRLQPDIVLMDYAMPTMDGVEASREILSRQPGVKILIVAASMSRHAIDSAISSGVHGLMLKDSTFDELITAIRAIYNNETYFCSKIMNAVAGTYAHRLSDDPMANGWTLKEREQEILRHLSNGMSSKQIARQINISPKTVDACRRQIMNKLRIDSIAGLVKFAIREGLTTL
ncbi:MAG TPA: response regulator transcription factor [Anaerohalosphaeraceae bacterium]|jgi:two-component system response regulator NreC|nr:response regulator transcription factor [Anaerohalosphaeraceae bacterium]HRT50760.1 response regulator transcription factor [Anaerohalosphaeraceae bacterium]HRT86796.1 response regulator transcription factor [Anaerohalosphaeraceae bacterium]